MSRRDAARVTLGGEQVEGRHAVRELLAAKRRRVLEVLLASGAEPAPIVDEIAALAARASVPLRLVANEQIDRVAVGEAHQGVLARAEPILADDLASLARPRGDLAPFLVVLDSVTDPFNLGAILRSASCTGVTGIVLPRRRSAHLSPTCLKAAAGAAEHLAFAVVAGTPAALSTLERLGVWRVGLDGAGECDLEEVALFDQPVALVLGAEGRGLSALVRQRCDLRARIELRGPVPSLNVSAAAAIACYRVARARRSLA